MSQVCYPLLPPSPIADITPLDLVLRKWNCLRSVTYSHGQYIVCVIHYSYRCFLIHWSCPHLSSDAAKYAEQGAAYFSASNVSGHTCHIYLTQNIIMFSGMVPFGIQSSLGRLCALFRLSINCRKLTVNFSSFTFVQQCQQEINHITYLFIGIFMALARNIRRVQTYECLFRRRDR
jgi:hypothetical protein